MEEYLNRLKGETILDVENMAENRCSELPAVLSRKSAKFVIPRAATGRVFRDLGGVKRRKFSVLLAFQGVVLTF